MTPMEASHRLAAVRVAEASAAEPRFWDPFAGSLIEEAAFSTITDTQREQEGAIISFLDEQLLQAVDIANMDLRQEYQQVVLLGCGFDTRPFRLPWPSGTMLFLLAPAQVHEAAVAALSRAPNGIPKVPRGCLLRRVAIDLEGCVDFGVDLEASGYQGNKLSVWGLQGLAQLELEDSKVEALLAHIANMASLQSFLVGELPPTSAVNAARWIAQAGFLGNLMPSSAEATAVSRNVSSSEGGTDAQAAMTKAPKSVNQGSNERFPRLFIAQQQHLSLPQMREYNTHTKAGDEDGEDFEGNFS